MHRKKALEVLYSIDELICGKMHQSLSEGKTKIVRYSGKDTFCGYVVCPHHFEAKTNAIKRHERRINHKNSLYNTGIITLTQFADTVHSAVDYLIKTGARSEKIESAVLMLYDQGVKTKDFKRLIAERGLK